ncbi:MAG: DUF1223 domain-containing protein [Acidobacteriota bacterium]|nr:DUF1223 domain-containing protein [Acidobacteriota bacterium]
MSINKVQLSMIVLLALSAMLAIRPELLHGVDAQTPVLVELFTSEGCSSCPPADKLLQRLDRQSIPGQETIVLSEHVDYWNHIGWKDPYSAHFFSERQSAYAERFGLDGVYTPQMVVDGTSEFVGSDSRLADKAFKKAVSTAKIPVHLSSISVDGSHVVHAHLETGLLDSSFGISGAELYVAVALNRAESQVSAGENSGRRLAHVSVVRSLTKITYLKQGEDFKKDVQLNLGPESDSRNLRLIAFIQESKQGRILGAAAVQVSPN